MKKNIFTRCTTSIVICLVLLLCLCSCESAIRDITQNSITNAGSTSGEARESDLPVVPEDTDFTYVEREETPATAGSVATAAAIAAPTVVEIRTETVTNTIFGTQTTPAAGSGVIVTENGYIVTCHHVVDGCTNVYVYTNDGTQYTAQIIATDIWSDLALIKIKSSEPLPYAKFAYNSEGKNYIVPGQQVIAVGNPLGYLGGSVTVGYISALGRQITVDGIPMTLLQTDTAISPGNSGGGLFNLYGELVGIVNAKSASADAENIGFAIPAAKALSVVDQLLSQGYVSGTPHLGITFSSQSSQYLYIKEYLHNAELKELNPDLTQDFILGGESEDILVAIDGNAVSSYSDIRSAIGTKKVGDIVTLTVYRVTGKNWFGYLEYQSYEIKVRIHEYTPE